MDSGNLGKSKIIIINNEFRPFESYENLISKAEELISIMSYEDRLVVINAHPRIGTNPQEFRIQISISYSILDSFHTKLSRTRL